MFSASIAVVVCAVVLLSEIRYELEATKQCYNDSDCYDGYCCKVKFYGPRACRPNCVGNYCFENSDCGGPDECCDPSPNRCTTGDCCQHNDQCAESWGQYCCKDKASRNVCNSSCIGITCYKDSDCGGPKECCRSKSEKCSTDCSNECETNWDCGSFKYCCKKKGSSYSDRNVCRSSCVGLPCFRDSDCLAPNECCRSSEKCSRNCSNECESNSDCGYGKYCCKKKRSVYSYNIRNVCSSSCVGLSCSRDSDCGGPNECCSSSDQCTKSCINECYSNSDCWDGMNYCCKKRDPYSSVDERNECNPDCVGSRCTNSYDCGGPGECCNSSNRCTTHCCKSNSDCSYDKYCCKDRKYPNKGNICNYDCIGITCNEDSDCGGPDECCSSDLPKTCSFFCSHYKPTGTVTTFNVGDGLTSWTIALIAVGGFLFVVLLLAVYFYSGWESRTRRRLTDDNILLELVQPVSSDDVAQNSQD